MHCLQRKGSIVARMLLSELRKLMRLLATNFLCALRQVTLSLWVGLHLGHPPYTLLRLLSQECLGATEQKCSQKSISTVVSRFGEHEWTGVDRMYFELQKQYSRTLCAFTPLSADQGEQQCYEVFRQPSDALFSALPHHLAIKRESVVGDCIYTAVLTAPAA